jgi:hypothetical protein
MDRYDNIEILKDSEGKRYYKTVLYPQITPKISDIYVITDAGDRLDNIARKFYSDTTLWWIISISNNMNQCSLYPTPGTQLRIPTEISDILKKYNELNNLR